VAGSCKHGNEPSGSTKGAETFDVQSDYQLSVTLMFRFISYIQDSIYSFL
jgi:hypothetical protein